MSAITENVTCPRRPIGSEAMASMVYAHFPSASDRSDRTKESMLIHKKDVRSLHPSAIRGQLIGEQSTLAMPRGERPEVCCHPTGPASFATYQSGGQNASSQPEKVSEQRSDHR